MKQTMTILLLLLAILFLGTGCFPVKSMEEKKEPAGFLMGIWHGWIAPVSLVVGFFDQNVRLYEVNNTGWWYDFGYYIAVIAGFGSIALSRKKKTDS